VDFLSFLCCEEVNRICGRRRRRGCNTPGGGTPEGLLSSMDRVISLEGIIRGLHSLMGTVTSLEGRVPIRKLRIVVFSFPSFACSEPQESTTGGTFKRL
jgi:hypothetical protein